MTIEERINDFKNDLIKEKMDFEDIVKKHLIESETYFFNEYIKKKNAELELKTILSKSFSIDNENIFIVGSGKMGFSLKPKNLFKKFDNKYSFTKIIKDRSDLDIAIISDDLYQRIGKSMYNYTAAYNKKWEKNEYYPKKNELIFPVPLCYKYFEYYTKGWFRPDYKPLGFDFCENGSFEELKGKINKLIKRKGSIAIYQNWFYFSEYHINNIKNLSLKLKTEKL